MNTYRQTQNSLSIVGAMAAGIFVVAFIALMVIGGYDFSPALFLGAAVAGAAGTVLLVGFHQKAEAPKQAAVARAPAPAPEPAPVAAPVAAAPAEAAAPTRLDGPRDGGPDDLKKIKGVGPKLETMLHGMGFYHYDQVANWTAAEVAWVDDNLEGFKGRVSRDNWVEQAKILAAGGETEFSKKVDGGDVY